MPNRFHLAKRIAAEAMRRTARLLRGIVPSRTIKAAGRLLIAPQDIRPSDATIAQDIFAGHLTFAGRHILTNGASIFDIAPPSYAFAEELHGFSWLRHARAAENIAANAAARNLVGDWIDLYGRSSSGFSQQPHLLSRRLISWLQQSPLLLHGADEDFHANFLRSLARQASSLRRAYRNGMDPLDRLPALIALTYYALCTDSSGLLLEWSRPRLIRELEIAILPDGGHISRNPEVLISLLLDLLPLQRTYSAREIPVPAVLPETISRMLQMLRLLRHSDGTVAGFNGTGATQSGLIAALTPYSAVTDIPDPDASYSGYQRLESGQGIVLVDAGRPPPSVWSTRANAGCLSLEFSYRGYRLLINCGTPLTGTEMLKRLSRSTAAHSTLILNDTSSARLADGTLSQHYLADQITRGPETLIYGRQLVENGEMLTAQHDGYAREYGLLHQRSLWLGEGGTRLEGQDSLLDASQKRHAGARKNLDAVPFALRFHLHPAVHVSLQREDHIAILTSNIGDIWIFEAGDQQIDIEESIYFSSPSGPQKTMQLVIQGKATAGTSINWTLTLQTPDKNR